MGVMELLQSPIRAVLRYQRIMGADLLTTGVIYTRRAQPSGHPLVESPDGYAIAVGYRGRGRWLTHSFRFRMRPGRPAIDMYWRSDELSPDCWTDVCTDSEGVFEAEEDYLTSGIDRAILSRLRAEFQTFVTFRDGFWKIWDDVAHELAAETYHVEAPDEFGIPMRLVEGCGFADDMIMDKLTMPWMRESSTPCRAIPDDPTTRTDQIQRPVFHGRSPFVPWENDDTQEFWAGDRSAWSGSENLELREISVPDDEPEWEGSEALEFREISVPDDDADETSPSA